MDLAVMIVDRAKALAIEDQQKNYIEYRISFHIHGSEDRPCYDKVYSFEIYPQKTAKRFSIHYNGASWKCAKGTPEFNRVCKTIFRQILRNHLAFMNAHILVDEVVYFQVMYKREPLFTDDYFVSEEIVRGDLGNHTLEDCADIEDLIALQNLFMTYIKLATSIDFFPRVALPSKPPRGHSTQHTQTDKDITN